MASLCLTPFFSVRYFAGLNWLRALMGICALVLQMMAPAAAQTATPGDWMVICGEAGPVLMQVSLSGNEPAPCPKCEKCEACQLVVSTGGILPVSLVSRFVPKAVAADVMPQSIVGQNPAQFWYKNRGPPLAQISLNDSARRLSHAVTPSKGGASWT
ncbi:hypothetical protein A9Q94_20985 [Rhodobacterales bacterium 56_14_T64]|nr:hypothetical protein A9Q94_20985 [Rhodobacterales bacterium 56_14_T64]